MNKRSARRHRLNLWWAQWLNRRLPPATQVTLAHKSIFILPTGFGLFWILLVLILFIFGTNYQNNLVIGLSILLLSLFNTCIIYSYRNLAGLTITASASPQAYAGETIVFPVTLSSVQHQYEVLLNYPDNPIQIVKTVEEEPTQALLPFDNLERGRVSPGRIKLESRYPLGLCRAWSHVNLDNPHIVFARPLPSQSQLKSLDADNEHLIDDRGSHVPGVDEFKGLKQHIPGESLKQVAWKQLAQGRGMLSKEFQQPQGKPHWLVIEDLKASELEKQISELTWTIDKMSERGEAFGLVIGRRKIAPSVGDSHRVHCLQQLALIPAVDGESS
ncbi:DUF58 domain-containing protein [uncultured Shewanella sp.]|uniref:DUF58 domain-containing protein n=1 Tax=Shewanella atlantica TaxID=271099 RepID=UPI0026187BA8|nr:DUF58 domain-containing protein [uncultured Shewanella sp.]